MELFATLVSERTIRRSEVWFWHLQPVFLSNLQPTGSSQWRHIWQVCDAIYRWFIVLIAAAGVSAWLSDCSLPVRRFSTHHFATTAPQPEVTFRRTTFQTELLSNLNISVHLQLLSAQCSKELGYSWREESSSKQSKVHLWLTQCPAIQSAATVWP